MWPNLRGAGITTSLGVSSDFESCWKISSSSVYQVIVSSFVLYVFIIITMLFS